MKKKRDRLLESRRAQITIFMIIGVVLLFSSALVLYIRGQVAERGISVEAAKAVEIPLQFKPLGDYVQWCIETVGKEGVTQIMQRGGIIYVNENLVSEEDDKENPDMMSVFPRGILNIPFWYYQKNGVDTVINVPSLRKKFIGDESIEGQLGRYLDENIDACLGNFGELSNLFEITKAGTPRTDVLVTKAAVIFTLRYPLQLKKGDSISTISLFQGSVKSNLQSMYDLALSITVNEGATSFLEQMAIEMFQKYSRKSTGSIPPVFGGEDVGSCTPLPSWDVSSIKTMAQNIISSTTPYLRINNTQFKRIIIPGSGRNERLRQRTYDDFIIDVTNQKYPNFQVSFMAGPFEKFSVNGQESGRVNPATRLDFSIPIINFGFCFIEYNFGYSFKYPVMVRIMDTTPDIESVFQFPIQVVVVKSTPRQVAGAPFPSASLGEENLSTTKLDCMKDQNNVDVLVNATDQAGKPVPAADVFYQCGPLSNKCRIGFTDEKGVFAGKVSGCLGGTLITQKQGYLTTLQKEGISSPRNISVKMTTLKQVRYNIMKNMVYVYNERKYRDEIELYESDPPQDYNPCTEIDGAYCLLCKSKDVQDSTLRRVGFAIAFSGLSLFDKDYCDRECKDASKIKASEGMQAFCALLGQEGSDSWSKYTYENKDEDTIINSSAILPICFMRSQTDTSALDKAMISFSKYDITTGLQESLPLDFSKGSGANNTIDLAPGRYSFNVTLLLAKPVTFKANSQTRVVKNKQGNNEIKMYPSTDQVMQAVITGGSSFMLSVTKEDLDQGKSLVFYVYDEGEPKVIEEAGEPTAQYPICQKAFGDAAIQPKWI